MIQRYLDQVNTSMLEKGDLPPGYRAKVDVRQGDRPGRLHYRLTVTRTLQSEMVVSEDDVYTGKFTKKLRYRAQALVKKLQEPQ